MNNGDMPAMPADIWVDEFLFDSDVPTPTKRTTAGLTKRERFAMAAMEGILANDKYEAPRRKRLEGMAIDAVGAADALLAELERTTND